MTSRHIKVINIVCNKLFLWSILLLSNGPTYVLATSQNPNLLTIHMTKITSSGYLNLVNSVVKTRNRHECVATCIRTPSCVAVAVKQFDYRAFKCATSSSFEWTPGPNSATVYKKVGEYMYGARCNPTSNTYVK